MLGAYATVLGIAGGLTLGAGAPGLLLPFALLFAISVTAAWSGAIGLGIFRPLAARGAQPLLVATIGVSLALQEFVGRVQGVKERWLPPILNEPHLLFGGAYEVVVTTMQMLVVGGVSVAVVLVLVGMRRSRFGRDWRAMADDAAMAALLGVDRDRTLTATFQLAGALAAVAGVVITTLYGGTSFHMGTIIGLKALVAAIVGGIGSLPGAVLGGLLLGHGEPGRFKPGHERIVSGVAAIGAAAMDALRLKMDSLADAEARGTEEARLAERLTFALNAGRMGSWALDVDSRAYEASDLCKANYGRRVDEDFGFDDLVGSIHPQDRDRMVAAMETAIRDGSDYDIEYRVIWPDGQIRWVHARGRADAIVPGGSAKRMAGVSLDITERRRAEERQQLMLNELNHRVKNTLAAVQSIAFQTLRTARSPAEFKDAFEARLLALSETHNLLTRENWEGASLRVVIGSELDALGGEGRAILEGPDIHLSPKAAVAMGMAIHELATNAVKYGALSVPRGLLNVDWRVRQGCLELEWRESNGPPVAPPEHRGFGSRLLERGLATELGGRVELVYREQGVACSMRLPLAALEEKD